jgi:AcrR family transcriptional regulator
MARRLPLTSKPDSDARIALLDAGETCLRKYGYSGLSTRRVAELAGMPLSQIHYHFGSKDALVLALLGYQNRRLLDRQRATLSADQPLWKRWDQACDFLDEDLASGYVRILQEMMAAGWSNPEIATAVRSFLDGWFELVTTVSKEALDRYGPLGPMRADDIGCLIGMAFLGAEAMLLLGFEDKNGMPIRRALRRFGAVIRKLEENQRKKG